MSTFNDIPATAIHMADQEQLVIFAWPEPIFDDLCTASEWWAEVVISSDPYFRGIGQDWFLGINC